MNLSKEIRAYLVAVRAEVVAQMRLQDFRASGRLIRNFRVVANQFLEGELRGEFYTRFLEKGFNDKPKSVSRLFIDNITRWMGFRGIQPERNNKIVPNTTTNIKRSAFAIAYSLIKKGRNKIGKPGIEIDKALKNNLDPYLQSIGKAFVKTYSDNLKVK